MTHERNDPGNRDRNPGHPGSAGRGTPPGDVVFDFSETTAVDFSSLSILFTARQVMEKPEGRVWVTGLPAQFWSYLRAMGLEGWFRQFPGSGPAEA